MGAGTGTHTAISAPPPLPTIKDVVCLLRPERDRASADGAGRPGAGGGRRPLRAGGDRLDDHQDAACRECAVRTPGSGAGSFSRNEEISVVE